MYTHTLEALLLYILFLSVQRNLDLVIHILFVSLAPLPQGQTYLMYNLSLGKKIGFRLSPGNEGQTYFLSISVMQCKQ